MTVKKFFTIYGKVESIEGISNRNIITESVYTFSYRYMKEIELIDSVAIVQISSANPGWSENTIEMQGFDHVELKDGSDLSDQENYQFQKL